MAARKSPAKPLACLTVGYERYLMDADKATQVMKILTESVTCEEQYAGGKYTFVMGDTPRLEMTIVRAGQVRQSTPSAHFQLEDRS
ncbi:hypothetical protein [Chitiniphilus eburneus]|uniref:hypothetical protein n=1 Tax=Chitiniphilus eburneus TaxID=2571148 RepID=UPI0035CF3F84